MRSMFKAWYMRSLVIPTMTRIRFLILIMGMNTLIDGGMNLPELMGKYPTVDSGSMSNDTPFNPHYFPIYPQCHHLWIVSPFSKGQHYHIYTIPSSVHTSSWDGIILKQRNLVRWFSQPTKISGKIGGSYPIGSMYAIYGDIYHQYTPNVSIYTIHGSYGYWYTCHPISSQLIQQFVDVPFNTSISYCGWLRNPASSNGWLKPK